MSTLPEQPHKLPGLGESAPGPALPEPHGCCRGVGASQTFPAKSAASAGQEVKGNRHSHSFAHALQTKGCMLVKTTRQDGRVCSCGGLQSQLP